MTTMYAIENDLPAGYVKDGSIDYTSVIQKVLKTQPNVLFPDFVLATGELTPMSGQTLNFQRNSKLIPFKPVGKYRIFALGNLSNVTFNSPVLQGDMNCDNGYGIGISACDNIVINNPYITNFSYDGIYIGSNSNGKINSNIKINGGQTNFNGRNGLSVITVKGLHVANSWFSDNNGAILGCGIDFEPNNPADVIQGVVLDNVRTQRCNIGISLGLGKAANSECDVTINNWQDKRSLKAFKSTVKANTGITGFLTLVNPYFNQNKDYTMTTGIFEPKFLVKVIHPKITSAANVALTSDQVHAALTYKTALNAGCNYQITI